MRTGFVLLLLFFLLCPVCWAEDVVEPADLGSILQKVAERQRVTAVPPERALRIAIKDSQISLVQDNEEAVAAIYFEAKSSTITMHSRLKSGADAFAFVATLQNNGRAYQPVVKPLNSTDALVFFSDADVFVYTQALDPDGRVVLKEWIYARKPNTAEGSRWFWNLKSEPFQWPLTMTMGPDSEAKINRRVPMAGMPIDKKAKDNFMLQTLVKFSPGDNVKKYFPFEEEISSIPPAKFWTKEGIGRQVNISVANSSLMTRTRPKPKHGLDFQAWDDLWQSVYMVTASASEKEYPLLIEP